MFEIEANVVVNQPIKKVFEFVTTPENDEQWLIGVKSKKTSEGPTKVGSTSESEMRFLGKTITVTYEVTEYEPPQKIEIKAVSGPVRVNAEEIFESVGANQTKVTVRGEADPTGIFNLAEPILKRMVQRQWKTSYENLKDVLEA